MLINNEVGMTKYNKKKTEKEKDDDDDDDDDDSNNNNNNNNNRFTASACPDTWQVAGPDEGCQVSPKRQQHLVI